MPFELIHHMDFNPPPAAGSERSLCTSFPLFQVGGTFTEEETLEQWRFSRSSCSKGVGFLLIADKSK